MSNKINDFNFDSEKPFKTLFNLVGLTKSKFLFLIFLHFITKTPVLFIPIFIAHIIDWLSGPKDDGLPLLIGMGITAFVFVALNIPAHVMYTNIISKEIRQMELTLRSQLIEQLQRLTICFHSDQETGRLQSKILRDVESIQMLCKQIATGLLPALIMITSSICIITYHQPLVLLFYMVTIPISVILLKIFKNKMRSTNRAFRLSTEEMSSKVSEMLTMIPITRAHALEELEIKKNNKTLVELKDKGVEVDSLMGLFASSSFCTMEFSGLFALIFSSFLCYKGFITVGEVVLFNTFFVAMLGTVRQIIGQYPQITKGFESLSSLAEIMEAPNLENNRGKRIFENVKGDMVLENVTFAYPSSNHNALENISVNIKSGETIAIVGESGSGKSTLMSLIIGFHNPDSGRILLDKVDLAECDLRSYRHFISVVPQNNLIFNGSIKDNITYGIDSIDCEKLRVIINAANVHEFADDLPNGINTLIGENGSKLSGGQKQRISIARALIRDPKVLIMDEATSALDVTSEKLVQEALMRLTANRTTFIVAHRLSTIRNADRIIVLHEGRIEEIGTHAELLSKGGIYKKMCSLQS